MMGRLFVFLCCIVSLMFVSVVSAQQVVIEQISEDPQSVGSSSSDPSKVNYVSEVRSPTDEDIIQGKKDKKKVGITVKVRRGVAHAMTVVGVNVTPMIIPGINGSQPWIQHQVMVYDPQYNQTFNTTMTRMNNTDVTYLYYYNWTRITHVYRVYRNVTDTPKKVKEGKVYDFEDENVDVWDFSLFLPLGFVRSFRIRLLR